MGGDRRKLFVALVGLAAVGLFLVARPSSGDAAAEPERREASFIRVGRHYVNVERILYAAEEEDGGWGVVLVLGPGEVERFKLEKVDASIILTWIDRRSFGHAPIRGTQLGPPVAALDPREKTFLRAGRYYVNTKRILYTTEEEGGGLVVAFGAGEGDRLKLNGESEAAVVLRWVDERSFNPPRFPARVPQRVGGPPVNSD